MLSMQKLITALLIASTPLPVFASANQTNQPNQTDKLENCDTILWSKESPMKAIVIRHLDHGNTAFLTCTGHLDETKKRHVMDTCKPIEPERQFYTEAELQANWHYLMKRSALDNLKPVLSDAALAFGLTELAVGVLAQKVLAGGVATIGERIAAKGPEAAESVAYVGKVLGGGANLFEGSRAVANDANLRFFPSYIGAGTGMAWAGFNMIKNGDLNRSMQKGSTMSPFGYRSYSCGPHELHRVLDVQEKFSGLHVKLRTPTVDEYEKTLRSALKESQERPDSWAITEHKKKELEKEISRSEAEKAADQSAPEIAPQAQTAALK